MTITSTQDVFLQLSGVPGVPAELFASWSDDVPDGSGKGSCVLDTAGDAVGVLLVEGPSAARVRPIEFISVHNADSAAIEATIYVDDGSNTANLIVKTIGAGETLTYERGAGWLI